MSELIKREDAIKATWHEPSYIDPYNVLTEVRDRIEALPTVDAVPVVRCGECKYYEDECCWREIQFMNAPEPNAFCSYGERKDGERRNDGIQT